MDAQLLHKVSGLLDALEQTTGEPGDLTSTLQHITQTAKKFFAADASVIFAINPITNQYIGSLTVVGDLLKRDNLSYKQPRAEGIAPQVLNRGVLLVSDVEAMPEYQSKFTRTEGIRSFAGLALSMRHSRKPLGVLYLDFRQPQQFSPNDQEIFQLFAEQASYILQETWLLRRYREVARIGQEINHELATVDILFEKLQQRAAGILDISHTLMLAVYQPQTNTLDLYFTEQGHYILREMYPLEGACKYSIETQQPLYIRHRSKEVERLPFQLAFVQTTGIGPGESLIFVPLMLRGVSLGVLSIQHPEPNVYNQEDLFILQLLANHIALALHNMRLYSSLGQLNETGQLLTQQLESEQTLQAIVDKIHDATKADLVVLYPYEPITQRFVLPPRIAGTLLDSISFQSMSSNRLDDIVAPMLRRVKPIFAKKSITVYTELHINIHIRQVSFGQREKFLSTAAMPLRVGDESVGVLFVNFRQTQRFDATQKLFIEGLAHYAAVAIKNAQTYGTLIQRRLHELEILQNIDRELSRTLDLESLLNTLLRLAYEHVHADEASLLLYNPRIQSLEIQAARGPHAETRKGYTISLQETRFITRWTLENKKPARVDNVHQDPQWRELYISTTSETISELDVPLLDGEETVGVLNVESTREGAFNQQDEDFLLTLAGQAVLAIKNAQAYEREKRLVEEGRVLKQISQQITSQLDPAYVFDLILEKALELTHSTLGSLHLYDPDLNDLRMAAERGVAEDKKGKRQGLHEGIVGHAAGDRRSFNVPDVSQSPWKEIYVEFIPGTRSELAVPMLARNELHGVLNVESPNPNNFSERDERLLQGLADLAVVALQNAQAYEREKRLLAEAQVLNQISKEITSQLDPVHVFDLILEKALELTHSNLGNLMLYDPDWNDLWMAAERGVAQDKKGARQGLNQGVVGYVATNKQLLNVDIFHSPWNEIYLEFFPGARSELAVPMLAGNELRGVLNVESPNLNNFGDSDVRLLQGLADLAVIALQNAQVFDTLSQRRVHELEILQSIERELSRTLNLESLLNTLLTLAREQVHADVAAILLYNPRTQTLDVPAAVGPHAESKRMNIISLQETKHITRWVLEHKKPARVDNVHSDPQWQNIYIQGTANIISELDVPLLDGEEAVGVLNFESARKGAFRQEDEDFLLALAGQAVIAIKNAQAFEREKRLAEEGRVLNEISKEITSQLDVTRVFDLILEKALELTHSTLGSLHLYDAELNDLQMVADRGVAEDKKGKRQNLDEGIVGYTARSRQLVNVVDMSQPPWDEIYPEFIPGTRSELAVPMLAGNELRGVLNIESPHPNNFSEGDERLLQGLADLAVVALQNARAYEREKRLAAEAQVLNEISKEITSQLDHVHIFDMILEKALELTHSNLGNLMLYDPDQNDLWMGAERGVSQDKKGARQGLHQGVIGYAARTKQLLNVDISRSPWNEIYLEFFPGARSELAVPMLAGNELRGVLNIESPHPNNFSESDERLLQGLADLAVIALQNAQAYEREKRLAEEGRLLNKISKEITSQLDFARVFDLILEKALELTHSTLGALMLYDPDLNDLRTVAARGVVEDKKGVRLSLQQGTVGYVARNKQLINADLSQPPWKEIYVEIAAGMSSELAVPMLAGNELRGVLNVESPNLNNFSESDERLLQGLADLAVIALQNAERYEKSRREAQRFELLYKAGQKLGRITELAQLELAYTTVVQIAEEYSQSLVVIRSYDEDSQELVMVRASQLEYAPVYSRQKLDVGVNGQVARERRTIVLHDTNNPPLGVVAPQVSDLTTHSLLITPIMFKERYYGNLGLSNKDVGYFRGADRLFFEGLAQQLASTIYRLETVQERLVSERLAEEAMSSIGLVAFELTHRWGNDLGLVESYTNDIRSKLQTVDLLSEFISKKLDNIVQAIRKILDLSKDLKQALAKPGETAISESLFKELMAIAGEPVVIHPRILLEEAQDTLPLPASTQIDLEIDEDVAAVRVIHSSVANILHNLVVNAIEAMPGGGKIMLKARNVDRFVALDVIDTGDGIPEKSLTKVFNFFYSTKGSYGFGLWSARHNALRNHGDLTVKSLVGQGTTFTLLLPRAEEESV